jgi:hypothetical protein
MLAEEGRGCIASQSYPRVVPGDERHTVASMSPRLIALAIAMGRTALGAVALLFPRLPARPWIGAPAETDGAAVLARALGARDLALGIGAWRTLAAKDDAAREWVAAGALADAMDATVTLAYWSRLPRKGRTLVLLAAGGASAAAGLAGWLDKRRG